MSLVPIDPTNEVAVITFLESGVAALSEALDRTDIAGVVNIKAQAATVETATKQLGLSKESQDVATELVRRSEWTLGRAMRKGQSEGTVSKREDNLPVGNGRVPNSPIRNSATPVTGLIRSNSERSDVYTLADATPEEFDAAIERARAEGNLSRANVVRKVAKPTADRRKPLTDSARNAGWDLRKAVERLQRIAADDRFAANKEQMAPHLRSHLENAVEVCQDLLARIDN